MSDRTYMVSSYDEWYVTLIRNGGSADRGAVRLTRSAITVIEREQLELFVSVMSGQTYKVHVGVRREQRALTSAALGMLIQ